VNVSISFLPPDTFGPLPEGLDPKDYVILITPTQLDLIPKAQALVAVAPPPAWLANFGRARFASDPDRQLLQEVAEAAPTAVLAMLTRLDRLTPEVRAGAEASLREPVKLVDEEDLDGRD
jgi:hypothetical protein